MESMNCKNLKNVRHRLAGIKNTGYKLINNNFITFKKISFNFMVHWGKKHPFINAKFI